MNTLHGKTILITGATSGFGRAAALLCASHGARLVLAGRRAERLTALEQELSAQGRAVLTRTLDVRHKDDVFHTLGSLPVPFNAIDVLVNNAGLALGLERAPNASLEDWEQMIETNINGMLYCTQAVLPGMVARNRGHIVTIGSVAGSYAYPGSNVYGASKAFVRQFSQNLRSDLLGKPIRVTLLEPGMAETEFSLVRFKGDEARAAGVYDNVTPLAPEDIAQAILWVISQPPHVNINSMEIMPVCQALAGPTVAR